jgi:hypothetical protein
MKKYLILYYSKTGNNRFLAEKLSSELCNNTVQEIIPKINILLVLLLMSRFKMSVGTGISKKDIVEHDEVVIFGPVWAGLLISPIRSILKKCVSASKPIHFAVSCETNDDEKNGKYGYAQVLKDAKNLGGNFMKTSEAFSISLVKNESQILNPKLTDNIKLSEENFNGIIESRFAKFVNDIKSS